MKLKSIIYFISTILFASCGSRYTKTDGEWTWVYYNAGGKSVKKIEVDDASFKTLKYKKYAMDKNKVLLRGLEINHADPNTFEIISKEHEYSKDKDYVYLASNMIAKADPKSFKILDWPYSKDKENVFCGNIPMNVSAVNEFIVTKSLGHRSYYSNTDFIKNNKEYEWLNALPIQMITVDERSEGETSSEKFRGFKKIKD